MTKVERTLEKLLSSPEELEEIAVDVARHEAQAEAAKERAALENEEAMPHGEVLALKALKAPSGEWPAPLGDAAFHGPAGDYVRAIAPHTEADPVAVLVQLLVGFGNVVGPTPFQWIDGARHHLNEFALLVGQSSRARKGTAWGHARAPLIEIEREWERRIQYGLSSGEGIIHAVRDPDLDGKKPDQGAFDKRLFVYAAEFAGVLKVQEREGSTLSTQVRNAWDGQPLQTPNKNSPERATGAHISIVAHITEPELRRCLRVTELFSGFMNRFAVFAVQRGPLQARGGQRDLKPVAVATDKLRLALGSARRIVEMDLDDAAWELWDEKYPELSQDYPGLLGAVTARAEAHVRRFAMLYAVLDGVGCVCLKHLEAGLELWRYSFDSARMLWGSSLGDSLADKLLQTLGSRRDGVTRSEIYDSLSRHVRREEIEGALRLLDARGLAHREFKETAGRPIEIWYAR